VQIAKRIGVQVSDMISACICSVQVRELFKSFAAAQSTGILQSAEIASSRDEFLLEHPLHGCVLFASKFFSIDYLFDLLENTQIPLFSNLFKMSVHHCRCTCIRSTAPHLCWPTSFRLFFCSMFVRPSARVLSLCTTSIDLSLWVLLPFSCCCWRRGEAFTNHRL